MAYTARRPEVFGHLNPECAVWVVGVRWLWTSLLLLSCSTSSGHLYCSTAVVLALDIFIAPQL